MNKKKKAYEVKSEKKTLSRSDYLQLVIDKLNACRHSPTSANSRTSTTTSSSDNILAKNSGAVDSSRHSSTASAASDNILAKTGAGEINNHHPSIVSSTSSSGDNILVDSNNILRNKVAPPSSANGIANGNANLQHQCDYRDEPFLQELLAGTAPWTVVNRHAFVPIPAYGLGNPQYRCFMNSVMQVLARAPALVAAVHDAATQYQQETSAHAKLLRELDKHMSGSGLVGSKSDAMTSFITSFQKAMEASKLAGSNTFDGNTQHDASDFVQKLLSLAAYVGNNNDLNHQSSLYKKEVPNVVLKTAVSTSTMIVQKKTKQCEDPEASAQKSCIYDMSTNIMLSLYDHDAKTNKKFTNVEDSVKAYLFAKSRYGGMTDLCTKAVKSGDGPYASEEKTVERWPSTLIIEVVRIDTYSSQPFSSIGLMCEDCE